MAESIAPDSKGYCLESKLAAIAYDPPSFDDSDGRNSGDRHEEETITMDFMDDIAFKYFLLGKYVQKQQGRTITNQMLSEWIDIAAKTDFDLDQHVESEYREDLNKLADPSTRDQYIGFISGVCAVTNLQMSVLLGELDDAKAADLFLADPESFRS